MPNKNNSDITDTSDTMRTTKSERAKGEILKRCFINMMKCIRVCKKSRNSKDKRKTSA